MDTRDTTAGDELDPLDIEGRGVFDRVRARLGFSDDVRQTVGRFELRRMLGRGGMGTVFLAHDPQLGRDVALKLVHTRSLASPERLRARLTREGQALAKLRHPNVVSVHELGEHEGEVFLAMEYVAGETLRDLQEREGISTVEVLEAYIAAGCGLAAAHRSGLVHRDFKPDNVFVATDGRVQVGDFGLALADLLRDLPQTDETSNEIADERLTQAGEVLGTLGYMAPEQIRGEPVTAHSDQYAFCVSVWEGLCGQRPFAGATREQLIVAMTEARIHGAEQLPRWLRAALVKGLAADPALRHASMDALVGVLEKGLARRSRWWRGGAFLAATLITTASLSYAYFSTNTDAAPCPLADVVERVRDSPAWSSTREKLEGAGAHGGLRQLEAHLERLALAADDVCASGDPLTEKHLRGWVEDLGRLLDTAQGRRIDQLLADIEEAGRARFDRPPPRAIAETVQSSLDASVQSERNNQLSDALRQARDAYAAAGELPVEQTLALLRMGRVRSLQGYAAQALEDFEAARPKAEVAAYDDARLRANLRAAEIAIKRLEDLDKAGYYLTNAGALLERLDEPRLSPRRAHYYDLRANSAKRRGRLDEARNYELRAVLRHAFVGDSRLFARALLNLGTIYDYRDEPAQAERCYRGALALLPKHDPDRYQVTLNLGVWLSEHGEDERAADEAEALLRETITGRYELAVAATTTVLTLKFLVDEPDIKAINALIRQLLELLTNDAPATPTHVIEAWRNLALAYAVTGEFGAPLDFAVEQLEALITDQDELAMTMLNLADFSRARLDIATQTVERTIAGLERLPASSTTDATLGLARELLADLNSESADQE